MIEELNRQFSKRKEELQARHARTLATTVDALTRWMGKENSLKKPAPQPAYGELTPTQLLAFKCAYEILLERMVQGIIGLAPDFAKLDQLAISHLRSGGWAETQTPLPEPVLTGRALLEWMPTAARREFYELLSAEELDAIKLKQGKLRIADNKSEKTVIQQHVLTHPACPDSFVCLYWRDEGNRNHTYFDIILGFGAPFTGLVTDAMLADIIFQSFRQTFASTVAPWRLITGGSFQGGRDGIGTYIKGLVMPERLSEQLSHEGLKAPPCLLCLSFYERLV